MRLIQILSNFTEVPQNWAPLDRLGARRRTCTQLLQGRKDEFRADPSYDLTGDGAVGPREYFIALRFDQGQKGRLTDEERKTCLEAIKNGYEENFLFGLETQAPVRDNKDPELLRVRVTQVDGKII